MKLFQAEIRIDKTKVIKSADEREDVPTPITENAESLSFLRKARRARGLNKTRSVNNADTTA